MEINTELNPTPHSERNHGIELLRIFAMLLAAVLHILKKGGVITASEGNLAAYSTVWLLEAAAYCAVNCYALISGYVGYSDRPKPLRLARCIELWLQVVFYSVIITTVYCIAGVGSVGVSDFADAFLPVTSKQYWYFTAYIGMFFFIPLLNALVRRLNRRALVSLCIMLIAVFSLYDTFASFWKKDPLALVGGHSPLWLGVLYIFGAAMKKLRVPESMSSKKALLIYASAAVFTALFKITGDRLLRFVPGSLFVRDTSPTVLLCAAALLVAFARFKPGRQAHRICRFVCTRRIRRLPAACFAARIRTRYRQSFCLYRAASVPADSVRRACLGRSYLGCRTCGGQSAHIAVQSLGCSEAVPKSRKIHTQAVDACC